MAGTKSPPRLYSGERWELFVPPEKLDLIIEASDHSDVFKIFGGVL